MNQSHYMNVRLERYGLGHGNPLSTQEYALLSNKDCHEAGSEAAVFLKAKNYRGIVGSDCTKLSQQVLVS